MPHSVLALAGGATLTTGGLKTTQADEIWSMNWSYLYDYIPRIDRLFEMHPVWLFARSDDPELEKMRQHWEWLKINLAIPVYMLAQLPQIPRCIRYPLEDIDKVLFNGQLLRGYEDKQLFTSSADYMMGMAVYQHVTKGWWDTIEVYGLEMGGDTEYRYQREGMMFWIGQAVAHGITVKIPANSRLLRIRLYAYEGGQMIYRHDLEQIRDKFEANKTAIFGKLQYLEGQMALLTEQGQDTTEFGLKLAEARADAYVAAGSLQTMEYLIKFVDLEEVEIELENPIKVIPVEADG